VRVIDTDASGAAERFGAFDTFTLNVADLTGNGHLSIVSLNDNLRTYVIDGWTGRVQADLATVHPGNATSPWGARDINGVAIGDLDGDGTPELVVLNGAATLTVFRLDRGGSHGGALDYQKTWSHVLDSTTVDPQFFATHPWYANGTDELGADGNPFIAHTPQGAVVLGQSDGYPGHFGYAADGTLLWHDDFWDGNAGPWAGKLTPNGPVMGVFATDGGNVVAQEAATGAIHWVFDARAHGADPGSIPSMANAYDLWGNGTKEVFVGARDAVDDGTPDWMSHAHARYFLLDAQGNQVWNASFDWGTPLLYMHPAAVDVNGDGVKDLVVLDWNTIGHNPGNWEKTGKANLFALDGRTGAALWHAPIDSAWSNKDVAVAPFMPGDPELQVLAEEQYGGRDGLGLYSLKDGSLVAYAPLPAPGWTITRGPVLADLDGDGYAEAIVPVTHDAKGCGHALDVGCREGALVIFSTRAPDAKVVASGNVLFDSGDQGQLAVSTHRTDAAPAKTRLG